MEDLHASRPKRRGSARHRSVDRPRTLRTAGDQHYRPITAQPEPLPGCVAQRVPVEPGDRRPQRDADRGGVSQPDTRSGGEHVGRHPGRQSVGQSGPGVRLVDDDRQATSSGGEVRGHRYVAAEAHHDLGPYLVEYCTGSLDRVVEPCRRL